MVITTAGEGGITTVGGMAAIMAGGIEDGSSTRSDGLRAPLKPLNLNVPAASYRQTGAGRSAHLTLTFGTVRSTYRAPAAGPLVADIRRGFESPEQKSLLVGSSFERGLGKRGLFGFPEILIV